MKTTSRLYVPFSIARELKDYLGFNEDCFGHYVGTELRGDWLPMDWNFKYVNDCYAPTYQQVVDYFRDEHNLILEIQSRFNPVKDLEFIPSIRKGHYSTLQEDNKYNKYKAYTEYYKAFDVLINEAIKLTK